MGKVDDLRREALKEWFSKGKKPTEEQWWSLIDAIVEAAEEHEHTPTGGPGTETGDATVISWLESGNEIDLPDSPTPGQVYIVSDYPSIYVCFSEGTWTKVWEGS